MRRLEAVFVVCALLGVGREVWRHAVVEYGVRFSKPIPVPDDDRGALLTVSGRVEDKLDGNRVVVGLTATIEGGTQVLSGARAVVRLP